MDLISEIKSLNNIHFSWRDYALFMLNSSPALLRNTWREKLITSIIHTEFNFNILSEGNYAGLEILTVLPKNLTLKVCDDSFNIGSWKRTYRISGSKKMQICLGHYPQESIAEEARKCIYFIIDNWDNCNYLINDIPLLKKIWDFSQLSNGNCLYPDEILTYSLEKDINNEIFGSWVDVCIDIYTNGIPSNKFKKYYFCDKYSNWDKENNKLLNFPFEVNNDLEKQKENFLKVCDIILKEDITGCPSWKRICICILKNDVSFRYAGFGMTYKERQAREQAMKAFEKIKKK